jgi:diketogulonate reductase-like aldo/keto reductase
MYLNNVVENHLPFIGADKFWKQMHEAFELLEKMCESGKIKYYGVASWASLRLPCADKDHINLQKIVEVAKKVGGNSHHFKFI